MVLDNLSINSSEIVNEFLQSPVFNGLSFLINVTKVVGILAIIYLIFLIIRSLYRARAIRDARTSMKNTIQINNKMDRIIKLLEEKKEKKKSKKK